MDESYGAFRPSFHWAFLGEITYDTSLFIGDRPRYIVKDKVGNGHPIHFHLDSLDGMLFNMNDRKDYKVGRTICVYYANQHNFFDGTIGLRIESKENVKVSLNHTYSLRLLYSKLVFILAFTRKIIPCSLEALIEVNVSELDQAVNCEACGKEGGGTLSKCSRCGVKYCDKVCISHIVHPVFFLSSWRRAEIYVYRAVRQKTGRSGIKRDALPFVRSESGRGRIGLRFAASGERI